MVLPPKLATEKATEAEKAQLRGILEECERLAAIPDRGTKEKFQELQIGIDLHRVIAAASGNAMLSEAINGILDKCKHYIWTELLWLDEWAVTRREHAEIVAAICAGDATLAGQLARRHVRASRDATLRLLEAKLGFQTFASDGLATLRQAPDSSSADVVGAGQLRVTALT